MVFQRNSFLSVADERKVSTSFNHLFYGLKYIYIYKGTSIFFINMENSADEVLSLA